MSSKKPLILVVSWGRQDTEPDFELAFQAHNAGKKLIMSSALPSRTMITNGHNVEKVIVIQPRRSNNYDRFRSEAEQNSITVVEIEQKSQISQHI